MYAIVRLNSFDPIKLEASPALEQFDQAATCLQVDNDGADVRAESGGSGAQSLGERGGQRGSVVGPRARGRPAPGTAHVPPV